MIECYAIDATRNDTTTSEQTHTKKPFQRFKHELWRDTKKIALAFLIQTIVLVFGVALFLYVEHCYDVVNKPMSNIEKSYLKICTRALESTVGTERNASLSGNFTTISKLDNNTTHQYNNITQQHENITQHHDNINTTSFHNKNNTLENATSINQHNNNSEQQLFKEYVASHCTQMETLTEQRKCEITYRTVSKYLDYVLNIGFTIGYGHVVTYSKTGKIATILYTIPSIAVSLNCLTICANILLTISKLVITIFEVKILKRKKEDNTRIEHLSVKVFILQVVTAVWLWISSSLIAYTYEDLDFIDSVYFVLISLTTVGFGDIPYTVEKYLNKPLIFILAFTIFFYGMAVMTSVITSFSEVINVKKGKKTRKNINPNDQK